MRIAITSDIHFFPHWQSRIKRFAELIQARKPDLLILAGDLGEPLEMFAEALKVFRPVCQTRAALAGNHDVWHRATPYTSQHLWESLLESTARAYGYHWLDRGNLVVDSIGICGTLAWYDYGGRAPMLGLSEVDCEQLKSLVSNDANYVDWPWTDREFVRLISAEFEARLDALQADPQVKEIIVVTHVPLFRNCLKEITTPEQGVLNAYYGNIQLGERVAQRGKVKAVFSGHVHQERRCQVPRANGAGPLSVYTIPADYGEPAALLLDTDTWQVSVIRAEVGVSSF